MSSKFVVKVESSLEQQENLRNSRKSLKVLQRASTDKENLVGRQIYGSQKAFVKSKSENDFNDTASDIKRKKLAGQPDRPPSSTSSTSSAASCSNPGPAPAVAAAASVRARRSSELLRITEEDLQAPTDATVSDGYWRELAEKRRVALDATLTENQELHEINASLKEELDVSNAMLDETRNLVEILTEMLEEGEAGAGCEKKEATIDEGFEQGESSRSFLHASLAEEAAEEGGVRVVAHSEDDEVAETAGEDEPKVAVQDEDETMKLAATTTTSAKTIQSVEEQLDADDEDSRGSSSQSSQSQSQSSNNSNTNKQQMTQVPEPEH